MNVLPGAKLVSRHVLMVTLFITLFGAGIAEGKKRVPPPPPGVPGQISALAKQLPGVMLVDAGPILSQIQTLVVDHMSEWMANRTPTVFETRNELESLFSVLPYPARAESTVFTQPWNGQMVIGAGYNLGWTDYDHQNVLAIFTSSVGKSHLATVTNFVPRVNLDFQMLPQLGWSDLRFFLYGTRPGKSQLRLSAILYSFDGQNLKPLWQSLDIYDGVIQFLGDKLTIKHLKEDEYVQAVERKEKPPRYLATYQLTTAGIELLDEHEIPF
jgi:hypothetical protein